MARIREKTLKFPGLDNTYTFADEADLFDSSESYAKGDYCIYSGDLYKCTVAHTGAWNADHFTAVKICEELLKLKEDLTYVPLTPTVHANAYVNIDRTYKHHKIIIDYSEINTEDETAFTRLLVVYPDASTQNVYTVGSALPWSRHLALVCNIDFIGDRVMIDCALCDKLPQSPIHDVIKRITLTGNDIYRIGLTSPNTVTPANVTYYAQKN